MPGCKKKEIKNPATGRCVSRTGRIGRAILEKPKSNAVPKTHLTNCQDDKIVNPQTGRCVSRTGSIGRAILKKPVQPTPKPSPTPTPNPKPSPTPKPTPRPRPTPRPTPKPRPSDGIKNTINLYEAKYPHMNTKKYIPSNPPTPDDVNVSTPKVYSPMDGNYTYVKLNMIPIINTVTSIELGNKGSFEYISYKVEGQQDDENIRHTQRAVEMTQRMTLVYTRAVRYTYTRSTVINPSQYSKYMNPEMYHIGEPHFLGFLQPTRGVCYIIAALNALAFSPLAPQLKTFLNKFGIYGTYSSDLQIATVFTDHIFSKLSVRKNVYTGGYAGNQLAALLKLMRVTKHVGFIDYYVDESTSTFEISTLVTKYSGSTDYNMHISLLDFIIIDDDGDEGPIGSNILAITESLKSSNMDVICGVLGMIHEDGRFHAVSLTTHNGIRCVVNPNDLVRYPYNWKEYDAFKLQKMIESMGYLRASNLHYVAMRIKE